MNGMSRRRTIGDRDRRPHAPHHSTYAVDEESDVIDPSVCRQWGDDRLTVWEKRELVLRVLAGEDIGFVGREAGVPVSELKHWLRSFVTSWTIALGVDVPRVRAFRPRS
jgi:hypothetical protein